MRRPSTLLLVCGAALRCLGVGLIVLLPAGLWATCPDVYKVEIDGEGTTNYYTAGSASIPTSISATYYCAAYRHDPPPNCVLVCQEGPGTFAVDLPSGYPAPGFYRITATHTFPDDVTTTSKPAYIAIILVDLDVDSDNNNGVAAPDRSQAEDDIEEAQPGKIVFVNDNDDDGDGVPDYADPKIPGEGNLVPLMVSLAGFPSMSKVRVSYSYDGPPSVDLPAFLATNPTDYTAAKQGTMRLWCRGDPTIERKPIYYVIPGHQYTLDELNYSGGEKTHLIEGVNAGENRMITLTVTYEGKTFSDQVAITIVVKIESVNWEGVLESDGQTNLKHDNPLLPHGGGYRIFAEKNKPDSSAPLHNKVRAVAKLASPVPVGQTAKLFFKVFDMDDPTDEFTLLLGPNVVDPDDVSAPYSGNDNFPLQIAGDPGIEPTGIVTPTGAVTPIIVSPTGIVEVTVPEGADSATVEYTITHPNPGNNWKVLVQPLQSLVLDVDIDTSATGRGLGFKQTSTGAVVPAKFQTELLAVWRTLHVETDSMGPVVNNFKQGTVTGITGGNFAATRVSVDQNLHDGSPDLSHLGGSACTYGYGRFENGWVQIGRNAVGVEPGPRITAGLDGNGDDYLEKLFGNGIEIPFKMTKQGCTLRGVVVALSGNTFTVNPTCTIAACCLSTDYIGGDLTVTGVEMPIQGVDVNRREVTVQGTVEIPYFAHDDDSAVLPDFPNASDLPRAFNDAYVEVKLDDVGDHSNSVQFELNTTGVVNAWNSRGYNQNEFWVGYVLSCYQPVVKGDADPHAEVYPPCPPSAMAMTDGGFGGSEIFKEMFKEFPNSFEMIVVDHEIAHNFLADHGDGGIMDAAQQTNPNATFAPATIRKIRYFSRPLP